MRSSRFWAGVAVCALVGATVTTGATVAVAQPDDDRIGGSAAVEKLGPRLAEVARRLGMTAPELAQQFLRDQSLFLDHRDDLLYVDPPASGADAAAPASDPAGIAPTSDAFTLHSVANAQRVIYLDFTGHTVANTAWNAKTGGDCYADGYDTEGGPTVFTESERSAIISIWARVAEDYRPFAIDVTTQDPGVEAIRRTSSTDYQFGARALITHSKSLCPNGKTVYASVCSSGCGGVAYVGVYDRVNATQPDYYQPAFVFQNGVGAGAKNLAEATSHEVGHNLGLSHDGSPTSGYYSGHGSWAPIMGTGYYKAITQWSRGEYAGATQSQDDLIVMQTFGAPARTDDHGDDITSASTLLADQTGKASANGEIATRTDHDMFGQTVGEGTLTITATPTSKSPDLDIRLELLSSSGAPIAADDPASGSTSGDTANGLSATITTTVDAGTYFVSLDGVGFGDPLNTGYSDYASIGSYQITTTWTATPTTTTLPPSTTTTTVPPTTTTTTTTPAPRMNAAVAVTGTRSASAKVSATATVTITDSSNTLRGVDGASVTGSWYSGATLLSTKSGTTDSSGVVRLLSGSFKAPPNSVVKFCVTSVVKSGWTYSSEPPACGFATV